MTTTEHQLRQALTVLLLAYQTTLMRQGWDERDVAKLYAVKKATDALERK